MATGVFRRGHRGEDGSRRVGTGGRASYTHTSHCGRLCPPYKAAVAADQHEDETR